jgi:hypothetical protein
MAKPAAPFGHRNLSITASIRTGSSPSISREPLLPLLPFQTRYGARQLPDVAIIEFRCFNTVKRTRTDFTVWTPLRSNLKALPVRILLQRP